MDAKQYRKELKDFLKSLVFRCKDRFNCLHSKIRCSGFHYQQDYSKFYELVDIGKSNKIFEVVLAKIINMKIYKTHIEYIFYNENIIFEKIEVIKYLSELFNYKPNLIFCSSKRLPEEQRQKYKELLVFFMLSGKFILDQFYDYILLYNENDDFLIEIIEKSKFQFVVNKIFEKGIYKFLCKTKMFEYIVDNNHEKFEIHLNEYVGDNLNKNVIESTITNNIKHHGCREFNDEMMLLVKKFSKYIRICKLIKLLQRCVHCKSNHSNLFEFLLLELKKRKFNFNNKNFSVYFYYYEEELEYGNYGLYSTARIALVKKYFTKNSTLLNFLVNSCKIDLIKILLETCKNDLNIDAY